MFRRVNNRFLVLFAVTCTTALGIAHVAYTQEEQPPAAVTADAATTPSTYLDLRRSKDRVTRLWAERYFTLTKLQEWGSAKGTKAKRKYVSHSPDLASVTLADAQGKQTEVQVAQLDKTCQSRVKQIAATQKKLDELLASGAKADPAQPGAEPGGDPGSPMVDERGVQPGPRRPQATRRPARPGREEPTQQPPAVERPSTPTETPPVDDGNPDPLGFGELPANPAAAFPPGTPGTTATVGVPLLGGEQPARTGNLKASGKEAWRSDYDAFRATLTSNASREAPQANWSAIKELQAAADVINKWEATGSVGEDAHREIAKMFGAVGEFTWEATLTDADVSTGDWTERLNLPPLPEPLAIGFILDKERPPGNWQQFNAGDRVKFVGRFIDIEDGTSIVAAIRFPGDAQTGDTAPVPDRPGLER
jgi:hypothetical protein